MQPRIVPRSEHNISRKLLSPNAVRTLYRLKDHGFIAYLVGGCVRDLLLGRSPKDFDIVTDATPGQIKRLFRNCRLVGRRFRLAHLHFQDEILEVSTFRAAATDDDEDPESANSGRHIKNEDGMVLRDNLFGTAEEDALRRDFTINALAYSIADFSVIDYTNGLSDLQKRIIRPIGDPYVRFTEDPVRMLRAIRFAASHDLEVEPDTWSAIGELASTISRAAPARLFDEMLKLFMLGSARRAFSLLDESSLLTPLFPCFAQWLFSNSDHRKVIDKALEWIDSEVRADKPPAAPLLLAALFGRFLEERSVMRHRDGLPRLQALDATIAAFLEETCLTVRIPAKIASRMRNIIAWQPALHKIPPRKPETMLKRAEFSDALEYLQLTATLSPENSKSYLWWTTFLESGISPGPPDIPDDTTTVKIRKRRRRRKKFPRSPD